MRVGADFGPGWIWFRIFLVQIKHVEYLDLFTETDLTQSVDLDGDIIDTPSTDMLSFPGLYGGSEKCASNRIVLR